VKDVDQGGTEQDADEEFTKNSRLVDQRAQVTGKFCRDQNNDQQYRKLQKITHVISWGPNFSLS
jgi:hypothetical protein